MVKTNTNERSNIPPTYKGNGGVYIGENDIDFDVSIIDKIFHETNSIVNYPSPKGNGLVKAHS